MGEGHLPVLVEEVLAFLALAPGSSVADGTVGGGGHAERILEATSPDGRLLGLDVDRAAISEAERHLARFGDRVELRQANFASLLGVARTAAFIAPALVPLIPSIATRSSSSSRSSTPQV